MSTVEFNEHAGRIAAQLVDLPMPERIAGACRGSGNPAALAWLAENLLIGHNSWVVDVGAGLGGPAAWFREHYRCRIVSLEPARRAAAASVELFGVDTIQGSADALPVRDLAFDSALLLGVLSVVQDRGAVLAEARRTAAMIGVMDYCSTGRADVGVGGSVFATVDRLTDAIGRTGWTVLQISDLPIDTPHTWRRVTSAIEVEPDPDQISVVEAIERGEIAPIMLVAS